MVEVIISDRAWNNLESIRSYIEQDSDLFASKFSDGVFKRIEILHFLPRAGCIVPEYELETVRELIFGSYRILYEILSEESIAILTIVHSARLLEL